MRLIEKQVTIVGGPDRMDFFLALAEFNRRRVVNFQYRPEDGGPVHHDEVVITGIKAYDGSDSAWWIFEGRFESGQPIHGHYNTQRRAGWIAPRDDARPEVPPGRREVGVRYFPETRRMLEEWGRRGR